MKHISLFELDVFAELSRSQSLRSVARNKGLTPSHVSKILTRLEKKLESNLFKRCASGLILSPEGKKLVGYAEKILQEAQALETHYTSTSQELIGIGGVNFLINRLLVPSLATLEKKRPQTRFRMMNLIPDQVMTSGMLGAYEIALHMGELPWPSSWESSLLGKMPFELAARRNHPLQALSSESEVQKYPFVVPNYWTSQGFYSGNDFCPLPWNQRKRGHEVSQAENAVAIVRHTDQLVFAPLLLLQPYVRSQEIKLIRVREWKESIHKPVCLSVQAQSITKLLQEELLSLLQSELKSALR